jgi:3D (Asp-Asp-Asp) domain-containing protein
MIEAFFISTILFPALQGTAFVQPSIPPQETRIVTVTAYSSAIDQCDADPFITAYNTKVRQGIVAANFLAKGTQIMFPEAFGSQVFVVEDKMHKRFKYRVDIWMPSTEEAKEFGIKKMKMIIL